MSKIEINILSSSESNFREELDRLLDRNQQTQPEVETTVRNIVGDVRTRGDVAVLEYTKQFDATESAEN